MRIDAPAIWTCVLAEEGRIKLANFVTLSRAALIAPILGLLAVSQTHAALGLYIVAATTDLADGWLARTLPSFERKPLI